LLVQLAPTPPSDDRGLHVAPLAEVVHTSPATHVPPWSHAAPSAMAGSQVPQAVVAPEAALHDPLAHCNDSAQAAPSATDPRFRTVRDTA